MIVAAALLLVAPGTATAIPGGNGVAKALHSKQALPLVVPAKEKTLKKATCHDDARWGNGSRAAKIGAKIGSKTAPVACEQPPRSQLLGPETMRHATQPRLPG
jgi:hypothetical protein